MLAAMEALQTDVFETRKRLWRALVLAGLLAVGGWVGLWFRLDRRWVAFVVWGVGDGLATILAVWLALLRCPRCKRRGFGVARTCRACGFSVPGNEIAPRFASS